TPALVGVTTPVQVGSDFVIVEIRAGVGVVGPIALLQTDDGHTRLAEFGRGDTAGEPGADNDHVDRIGSFHLPWFTFDSFRRGYRAQVTTFSTDISRMAEAGPSLPYPLPFTPPYGMLSARKLEHSLMCTPPVSSAAATRVAVSMDEVKTPAMRPNSRLLAAATASSSESTG